MKINPKLSSFNCIFPSGGVKDVAFDKSNLIFTHSASHVLIFHFQLSLKLYFSLCQGISTSLVHLLFPSISISLSISPSLEVRIGVSMSFIFSIATYINRYSRYLSISPSIEVGIDESISLTFYLTIYINSSSSRCLFLSPFFFLSLYPSISMPRIVECLHRIDLLP